MYTVDEFNTGNRRSLSEIVTDTLRYNILAGKMMSGNRIKESELAAEMEVSRAVIREAFIRLEAEGLIEKEINRSAYIKRFDYEDTDDLFEWRRVLELAAADRIIDKNIDVAGDLERRLRTMKLQSFKADYKYIDLIRLDLDFHRFIICKCGNKHILRSWEMLRGQLLVVLYAIARLKYTMTSDLDVSMQQTHEPLVRAFQERDRERLHREIEEHIGFGYYNDSVTLEAALDSGLKH